MREVKIKPEYVPFIEELFNRKDPKLTYKQIAVAINKEYDLDATLNTVYSFCSKMGWQRNTYKNRKQRKKKEKPSRYDAKFLKRFKTMVEIMCKGHHPDEVIVGQVAMCSGVGCTRQEVREWTQKQIKKIRGR